MPYVDCKEDWHALKGPLHTDRNYGCQAKNSSQRRWDSHVMMKAGWDLLTNGKEPTEKL